MSGDEQTAESGTSRAGWRNVFSLGAVSFFTDVSTEMVYPLLPVFLTTTLGASAAVLGAIEGAAESLASLLKLASGHWADRLGVKKPLMVAGYTVSSAAKPLVALATAPWHVLAVRLADRAGKGVRTAPRDALMADSVERGQLGRAFGLQRTMDHAGAIVGPLVAAGLLLAFPGALRLVFALSAVPAALCVLCLVLFVRDRARPARTAGDTPATRTPLSRTLYAYVALVFVFTLGNSSDAFLLLRAGDLLLAPAAVPVAWVVLHISKMITSTPGGMVSDRIGRRATIALGWLVYAAVYVGFAMASAPLHAWVLFAVYGVFYGLTEGVEKAFVADLAPAESRGRAFGLFNFAIGIGALPASVTMGALWKAYGPETAFLTGAGLALVAAGSLFAIVRPARARNASQT